MSAGFAICAGDLIARFDARHSRADGNDIAGHFMAGHERELDPIAVCTIAHQKIVKANATGTNANKDLIILRLRRRRVVLRLLALRVRRCCAGPLPALFAPLSFFLFQGFPKIGGIASQQLGVLAGARREAWHRVYALEIPGRDDTRKVPVSLISMSRRCPRRHVSRCATTS